MTSSKEWLSVPAISSNTFKLGTKSGDKTVRIVFGDAYTEREADVNFHAAVSLTRGGAKALAEHILKLLQDSEGSGDAMLTAPEGVSIH
jgi:hypothetical protein